MKQSVVLMYHDLYLHSPVESGFQNESAFQYKIQVDEFERQVKAVAEYCQGHPEVEVEFTFDDGGVSFLTLAAPVLEKYGFRGTFFISTAYLNTPLFLTTAQVEELAERGHRIGSHSHTHPVLTELDADGVAQEWKKSVEILRPSIPGQLIASIPNGNDNKVVMKKAVEAGIQSLYTSIPTTRVTTLDSMLVVGRYVVYQGMGVDRVMKIISNEGHRRLLYVRWSLLRGAKSILGHHYNTLKAFILKEK